MKLIFSIIFLISCNLSYAYIINIYHHKQSEKALSVENIFLDKYNIPKSFMNVDSSGCFNKLDIRMLNLCITKKGKLIMLPSNIDFLRKSLSVFRTPRKVEILNDY